MYKKHSIKTSITVGILLMMIVGLLLPSISASIETDSGDGFWLDNFDYSSNEEARENLILTNCSIYNGSVMFNRSTEGLTYKIDGSSHKAYSYPTSFFIPFFFSPNNHIRFEDQFENYLEYPGIKSLDNKYADRSSKGFKKQVVQHFRFKLASDEESIGKLHIQWYGKAIDEVNNDNEVQINLYYWKYFGESKRFGSWMPLQKNERSNNTDITIFKNITKDDAKQALGEDNHFDICIVAIPSSSACTLYSNYVEIVSEEEGYKTGSGYVETINPINPREISELSESEDFYWEMLTWSDYERGENATVKYQVLYEESEGNYSLVEEDILEGNDQGFTDAPVFLNSIPNQIDERYNKLKLKAHLYSINPSVSPKIFDWTLTWQLKNRWQDLFNYTCRTSVKNKIQFLSNGNVSINPVTGDWPMFGQNPQNTRYQEGNGPDSEVLNWYSIIKEGNNLINPVIKDGILYVTNVKANELFTLDITETGSEGDWEIDTEQIDFDFGKDIISSPAITDEYIIVATGETANAEIENFVYVITRDNNPSEKMKYDNGADICYWGSPIVHNNFVYISSWSGDKDILQSNQNYKLIALDLNSLSEHWVFDLPSHSFSTPAYYDNMVYIGCKEKNDDSFFAIDAETGDHVWNKSLGVIGRSSPVIYDDTVFVVSENKRLGLTSAKITALRADNGTILWETSISGPMTVGDIYPTSQTLADSTPTIHADTLFVASPNGEILALDTKNGTEKWSTKIYTKPIGSDEILSTSPAYADGKIYIGTPDGNLYVLDAADGTEKIIFTTLLPRDGFAVVTSPIISNGLVFFGDENGKIYSIGSYIEPGNQITGNLISIPIELPSGNWWNNFYAKIKTSSGGNNIRFNILDENKNHIREIQTGDEITGDRVIPRIIRLQANLSADNISVNPELASWYVTFEEDTQAPEFDKSTFKPNPDGWLNKPDPECSIEVWDNGTGLLVNSAKYTKYTITYNEQNTSTPLEYSGQPQYTGVNGTNFSILSVNVSALDISANISNLTSITFSISDLADNTALFSMNFYQDTKKPVSNIINETYGKEFSSEFVIINATAEDPSDEDAASDIRLVELYYRYSYSNDFSGDWILFDNSTEKSPSWNFSDQKHGGYYELCTIAYDNIGNVEEFPEEGDVWFIFDNEPPKILNELTEVHWFKEIPTISIEFSDDFLLDTIKYRPEFETEWTVIDSGIEQKTYDSEWDLDQDYWDQMDDGEQYLLHFWTNDSLGNIQTIVTDGNDNKIGYKIVKDAAKPNVDLEMPNLETEWSFEDTFTISAFATDGGGSGIKSVELFYRYSDDGEFDGNWTSYGVLIYEPFEWEFKAEEGNGYYEFKVVAEDIAGNVAESEVFSTGINIFPVYSVVAMVILIIALILITFVIFIKWRKK